MPTRDDILSSLGLEPLIADRGFRRDAATGNLAGPSGPRVVLAGPELIRSLYLILTRERAGSWAAILKAGGDTCGRKFAAELEVRLAALGKPALASLPLEACLVLIEDYFTTHGLGLLALDLAHTAEHGVVVAHLEHSFFARVLPEDNIFADPMPAGLLQGFLAHISGEGLGCEEIACVRNGAPRCTFVLTALERLAAVAPFIGREDVDGIVARLCA